MFEKKTGDVLQYLSLSYDYNKRNKLLTELYNDGGTTFLGSLEQQSWCDHSDQRTHSTECKQIPADFRSLHFHAALVSVGPKHPVSHTAGSSVLVCLAFESV